MYLSLNHYLNSHSTYRQLIAFITRYMTYPYYALYPLMLVYLFFTHSDLLLVMILKPAFVFVFITLFRKLIDRPRPYDQLDITPVEPHKKGHSFPSRHTGSALIIALMALEVNQVLGIIMIIIACIIAITRVLGGLHYLSDVITAALLAFVVFMI